MRQERLYGGGQQGRASVTCSPDRGGSHFLIGVIDTALPRWYFPVQPKRPFKIPIPFETDFQYCFAPETQYVLEEAYTPQ